MRRKISANRAVPRLDLAQRVIAIDAPIVRRLWRGINQSGLEQKRRCRGPYDRLRLRKRRLSSELARNRRVRTVVVGDAVSASEHRALCDSIRNADARTNVVGIWIEQAARERPGK